MKHCLSFERLGLLQSFRRLWVCCKSSLYWVVVVYYWDFELSYKHLVTLEAHHPFVPMYCSLVLLKTLFLSLVPYTTVLYFPKKKMRPKIGAPHGSCGGPPSSVSEPKIRFGSKPNRRKKSALVWPNRAPGLKFLFLKEQIKDITHHTQF
jgi:hypothetical protein